MLTARLGTRANLNYLDQLTRFHKQHGNSLTRFPSVDKRPLDLYKLKKAVEVRGGFDQVCKLKKWAEIGRDLGYSGKIMSSLSTSLKNSYQRWLQPYEDYLLVAKPGVQHQLGLEHGGPYVPSPKLSPNERATSAKASEVNSGPAEKASAALNASIEESEQRQKESIASANAETPSHSTTTCGFTAVNSNVNRFVPDVKQERENGTEPPRRSGKLFLPVENATGSDSALTTNGNGATPLKRMQSHDSASNSPADNGDPSGRRSKRLKKGRPNLVLCSTWLIYTDAH